jgi:hypothetical protein
MDQQLVVPYILSLVVAFAYSLAAWKWPQVARFTLGIGFLFSSLFNLWWALTSPGVYVQAYGPYAIRLYREFIHGPFARHTALFVTAIACGQFVIGALAFAPLPWRRVAYAGAIAFLLAISPLGIGAGFPSSLILAAAIGLLLRRDRVQPAESAALR